MRSEKKQSQKIVEKKIGEKTLKMGSDHKLPIYIAEFPAYDRALPRISERLFEIDGYLRFIDIGANIGDTVSLVTDRVDGEFLCVEGDKNYLPLLKHNVSQIKNAKVVVADSYCGEDLKSGQQLRIHHENGTAHLEVADSPKGQGVVTKSLDSIIAEHPNFKNANLLKIDTDGFEINVLKSGFNFLKEAQPIIFFEFDPAFYSEHHPDPLIVFDLLRKCGYDEALFYDNFGAPIKVVNLKNKSEVSALLKMIDMDEIFYFDVLTFPRSKIHEYRSLFESELMESSLLFNRLYKNNKKELAKEVQNSNSVKLELVEAKSELEQTKLLLNSVLSSKGWRAVEVVRRLVAFFLPPGSGRRKVVSRTAHFARRLLSLAKRVARKILSLFFRLEAFFFLIFPTKSAKPGSGAKKLLYVGHSYHQKTKSTVFLIDYLKKHYDVEVINDESWKGDGTPYPDLSFVDQSYAGVIFFQNLPDKGTLKRINNRNLIFFPMYDASGGWDYLYWRRWRKLKIVNFSKTLHEKLKGWGFNTIYVQFFPDKKDFLPGKKDEVFFWQRLGQINIQTMDELFGDSKVKIHLHKAIDPGHTFLAPTKEEEKKFQITYSEWFETRDEMWDLIEEKGIFIAPREFEGIGMSFLEAMAMGKAVVACDNPTMNEYIKDGETGYLFTPGKPHRIDLSNIEELQKRTHQYMKEGFESWQEDKKKIISFIEGR